MAIKGKLFGLIGQAPQDMASAAPETANPGYGAWYARQMARSYEASRRRKTAAIVAMFPIGQHLPLPLAA